MPDPTTRKNAEPGGGSVKKLISELEFARQQLEQAIVLLKSCEQNLYGQKHDDNTISSHRGVISEQGRLRISAAAKRRWARWRLEQKRLAS